MSRPIIAGVAAIASLLGVAACAPTATAPTGTDLGRAQALGYGVIASIRPITVSSDAHANLVTAFGVGGSPAASAVEFIVREDSGDAISVVQGNQENFRPGDRVGVARGARTGIIKVR